MAPSPAVREAWRLMSGVFHAQRHRFVARVGELGLSPMQAMALRALEPGRPLPMSALAGALRCDNSNVTGLADRLEAAGLVERRPAEHDRRIKTLVVTERGAALKAEVEQAMLEPPPELAGLSDADARALQDILARTLGPA